MRRFASSVLVCVALAVCASAGSTSVSTIVVSAVCTSSNDAPAGVVTPIYGRDNDVLCKVHDGIVNGATAYAQYTNSMNTTGWDDLRVHVLDRSGEW